MCESSPSPSKLLFSEGKSLQSKKIKQEINEIQKAHFKRDLSYLIKSFKTADHIFVLKPIIDSYFKDN